MMQEQAFRIAVLRALYILMLALVGRADQKLIDDWRMETIKSGGPKMGEV